MAIKQSRGPGYLGNKNLKPAGVKLEFTQEQVEEYIKCAKDPIYFAKKYVKVVTLDKGVTQFDLYDYQERLVEKLCNNRFVIGKLARQSGKTTTVGCCYLLHKVLFNQNMSVAILANKLNTAREILSRIREAYEHLPWWLQQGIMEWNKGSIQLENGSKILASATSSSAIRGGSYNCISGDSTITIKDLYSGEIYDITIEEFYANSSRNINYDKYLNDNGRKQIQEVVLFSDGESKNPLRDIEDLRETSCNSQIFGWNRSKRQYCSFNNKRTFISTPSTSTFFEWNGKIENGSCLLQNGKWETRKNCPFERIDFIGSQEKLFRSEKNNENGFKTFSRNKKENITIQQRKNTFRRSKRKNKQSKHWAFSWNQETTGIWGTHFTEINWNEKNERTFRQDQQKSIENSKNSRETSWDEKITRSKRKNAIGRIEKDRKKWWSLEQGKETHRWEVLTANGFKKFRGISKSFDQPTIKITFVDDTQLICTSDHKIATTLGFVEVNKLTNDHLILCKNKTLNIKDKILFNKTDVYDLLEVDDVHSFYANNILVHNCIFLDEFAFVPTTVAEEFFSSVYPTITAGQSTQMIIISTPKGLNMFYQLWKGATSKQNEYVPFEVNWQEVPQYPGGPLRDEAWKEQQIKNTSERQFDAEFNCSFIGSANTLIDAQKLNQLSYGKPKQRNAEGLLIYQEPVKGVEDKGTKDRDYFITVDVARGQGGDNSAFTVFDISDMPYRIVARFKSNTVSPLLLPSYIRSVGKKYNTAHVLVEVNDIGSQVADILHYDLEYENLVKAAFKGHKGQTITETGMGAKRVQLGVRTTVPVKKLGCAVLKNLIEQDKLLVEDADTIDELTTFIADGQSFAADEGHTDDLVMTLVLFAWATRQDFFEALTNKDVRVELFEKDIEKIENEIIPMFVEDGFGERSEWDGEDRWFDEKDPRRNQFGTQYWLF
jgi:hypothetical protein